MSARLQQIVERAIAEGVLPADAVAAPPPERPWPVILLTALGSWLAVMPILLLFALFMGDFFTRGAGPFIGGFLALGVSIGMLRAAQIPLFLEQLAIPVMLAGSVLIGIGLEDSVPDDVAWALMGVLALAVAILVRHNWLRILLGATACGLMLMVMAPNKYGAPSASFIFALYVSMAAWATCQLGKRAVPTNDMGLRTARAIDAISMGWGAVTLAGLALSAGRTFMTGAIFEGVVGFDGGSRDSSAILVWHVISALTAGAAAAHLVKAWPSLRQTWAAVVAIVVIALSLLMPTLGATLLFLAMCATAGRWRLAAMAGLSAAWIIGALYYQVNLPFVTKALIMIVAGAALGASAWLSLRGRAALDKLHSTGVAGLRGSAGIALTAGAVLLVANGAIWQKETLIANGQPVFVELAPVDPRSLMQGDYMQLSFAMAPELDAHINESPNGNILAVGKIDERGVLTLHRKDDGSALAQNERRLRISHNANGARIVTDAWYFREGEAGRYAGARYGEFRLLDNGRALLVGMRGPNLEKL